MRISRGQYRTARRYLQIRQHYHEYRTICVMTYGLIFIASSISILLGIDLVTCAMHDPCTTDSSTIRIYQTDEHINCETTTLSPLLYPHIKPAVQDKEIQYLCSIVKDVVPYVPYNTIVQYQCAWYTKHDRRSLYIFLLTISLSLLSIQQMLRYCVNTSHTNIIAGFLVLGMSMVVVAKLL
jgi:hypothetical protein